ncbi:MAG TPA: iron-sulfur cluster assembly protein IscA [Pseudomonadales bacterium]
MTISLTQAAADHVKQFMENRGKGSGVRVGVTTTGCSGLAYVLEFVDTPNEEDTVFSCRDVNIFVDPKSLVYLDGTEMDYVKQGLNEGFEFYNPNTKGTCGCGESFTV